MAAVLMACDGSAEGGRAGQILDLQGDITTGGALYVSNTCSTCHGEAGEGGIGPNVQEVDAASTVDSILNPPTISMDGYAAGLSDQNIADISAFVESL